MIPLRDHCSYADRHPAISLALRYRGVDLVDRPAYDDGGDGGTGDAPALRIRVEGTPEVAAVAVAVLRAVFPVTHVSQPHAGPGSHVRVYVHSDEPVPGECFG